jgi:DNA-3-methyladenine glycosylase I
VGSSLHGDRALFEKMSLEGFQAGLSWITILRKRPRFREVFANFEPAVVAEFDEDDVERLMADAGIIRNRAKILATIGNARLVREMEPGALDDHVVFRAAPRTSRRPVAFADVPAVTAASDALSKALRSAGDRDRGTRRSWRTRWIIGGRSPRGVSIAPRRTAPGCTREHGRIRPPTSEQDDPIVGSSPHAQGHAAVDFVT